MSKEELEIKNGNYTVTFDGVYIHGFMCYRNGKRVRGTKENGGGRHYSYDDFRALKKRVQDLEARKTNRARLDSDMDRTIWHEAFTADIMDAYNDAKLQFVM